MAKQNSFENRKQRKVPPDLHLGIHFLTLTWTLKSDHFEEEWKPQLCKAQRRFVDVGWPMPYHPWDLYIYLQTYVGKYTSPRDGMADIRK